MGAGAPCTMDGHMQLQQASGRLSGMRCGQPLGLTELQCGYVFLLGENGLSMLCGVVSSGGPC